MESAALTLCSVVALTVAGDLFIKCFFYHVLVWVHIGQILTILISYAHVAFSSGGAVGYFAGDRLAFVHTAWLAFCLLQWLVDGAVVSYSIGVGIVHDFVDMVDCFATVVVFHWRGRKRDRGREGEREGGGRGGGEK